MIKRPTNGQILVDGEGEKGQQSGEMCGDQQTLADQPFAAAKKSHRRVAEDTAHAAQQVRQRQTIRG